MRRPDPSITIALCLSLALHSGLALLWLGLEIRRLNAMTHWPPLAANLWHMDRGARLGQADAAGIAVNQAPGDQPARARLGEQDQAWLSLDPVGHDALRDGPALPPLLDQEIAATPMAPRAAQAEEPGPAPFGVPAGPAVTVRVRHAPPLPPSPPPIALNNGPPVPPSVPVDAFAVASERAGASAAAPAGSTAAVVLPRQRGGASNAADPAPRGDMESDPFARIPSATIRAGRIDAQLGRAFRAVLPRLSLKGQMDVATMACRDVVLRVRTDETGKVADVSIIRSSGSNEVDLPAQLAMWKWWFEPPRDKDGRPMPDSFPFRFSWR